MDNDILLFFQEEFYGVLKFSSTNNISTNELNIAVKKLEYAYNFENFENLSFQKDLKFIEFLNYLNDNDYIYLLKSIDIDEEFDIKFKLTEKGKNLFSIIDL